MPSFWVGHTDCLCHGLPDAGLTKQVNAMLQNQRSRQLTLGAASVDAGLLPAYLPHRLKQGPQQVFQVGMLQQFAQSRHRLSLPIRPQEKIVPRRFFGKLALAFPDNESADALGAFLN
jgi:hypothetical protein